MPRVHPEYQGFFQFNSKWETPVRVCGGLGFRASGMEFRVWGLGFRLNSKRESETPSGQRPPCLPRITKQFVSSDQPCLTKNTFCDSSIATLHPKPYTLVSRQRNRDLHTRRGGGMLSRKENPSTDQNLQACNLYLNAGTRFHKGTLNPNPLHLKP